MSELFFFSVGEFEDVVGDFVVADKEIDGRSAGLVEEGAEVGLTEVGGSFVEVEGTALFAALAYLDEVNLTVAFDGTYESAFFGSGDSGEHFGRVVVLSERCVGDVDLSAEEFGCFFDGFGFAFILVHHILGFLEIKKIGFEDFFHISRVGGNVVIVVDFVDSHGEKIL